LAPPGIIPYPHIDPDMLRIGRFAIHWYGMAYLTGFVLGYLVLIRLTRLQVMRIKAEWLGDLVGWLALGVVIGGRTGWWIFYHHHMERLHDQRVERWWEPIAVWHGGMSFHGGFLGVVLVLWIWSRIQKASFLNLTDCLALVAPIGIFLGRIANFINGELFGRESHVPWAMIFPSDPLGLPRHPSQIYEAILEGPVLLALVWLTKWLRGRRDGQIAATFVIFYAVFRFLVEFTREPDEQLGHILGPLTMGQLLSLAMGLAGLIWWIALLRSKPLEPA